MLILLVVPFPVEPQPAQAGQRQLALDLGVLGGVAGRVCLVVCLLKRSREENG